MRLKRANHLVMFTQNVLLVRLLAVVSFALCWIPAGGHLFELANKVFAKACRASARLTSAHR
jgi:hypothetical protein